MQEFKNYNKISPELEKMQRKLQPGETATFQIIPHVVNIDPDPQVMLAQPRHYSKRQLPTKQTIKDPGNKNKPVEIAFFNVVDTDKIEFKTFIAGIYNNTNIPNYHKNGRFTLSGDVFEDCELCEIISLTNENQRNPNRDASKEALFYEIIETEIAGGNNERRRILKEALDKVDAMDEQEIKDIAAALSFPYGLEPVIVRDSVATFAENSPKEFLSLIKDELTPIKSDINKALKSDVIQYEIGDGRVKMGATVLTTLAGYNNAGFDYVKKFAEYLQSTPDGQKQYKAIKAQLKNQ